MEFPFGQSVVRSRRASIPNPYNPAQTTRGDWDSSLDLPLTDAFIASSSSASTSSATRSQILTSKSLYLTDAAADVRPGDRITGADGVYYVHVRPSADVSPFSGWQPVVEIPLENTEG